MRKRRQGFSMFASYGEVCEAFGGRGYNFTARCEGAQLALSSQEALQSDACPERSRRISISAQDRRRLLRFARNDRLLANVILRHVVPKNLVHGKKIPYV